jgi:putative transposase
MNNYKNKYRIQSHRKPNWDYSADAHYFLTIVTQNRACNLGEIVKSEMKLSDFGEIVVQEWLRSFEIRDELILHQFILMPNHLHAIVEIQNKNRGKMMDGGTTVGDTTVVGGTTVETHGRASLRMDQRSDQRSDQRMDQRSDQRTDQCPDDHQLREIKRHPPVRLHSCFGILANELMMKCC